MAERALAHVELINNIEPIPGADRIVVATVLGWKVVVAKADNFNIGDKVVYIEIDSRVPEKPEFEFLRDRKFKVKTIKLRGQISQGLILPISILGRDAAIGEDVTNELGIYYYDPADQARKAPSGDKYKKMAQRHPKLFKKPFIKWLMKRNWGKKLLFIFFGKKRDKKNSWPTWVAKTDEERIQNIPYVLQNKIPWIVTEKIDGTSTTFTMKKRDKTLKVCSRNVVFDKPDKKCFYDTNVYTEMAIKYDIENVIKQLFRNEFKDAEWITIQGETFGAGIQKRDYGMTEHDFRAFNLITSISGRLNSELSAQILAKYGIKWVPIIQNDYILPDTVYELLEFATGSSEIDGGMREGYVFRSQDGTMSFKAVSNEFLLKYHA